LKVPRYIVGLTALLVTGCSVLFTDGSPASATTAQTTLRSKLLSLSDLPPGWTLSMLPASIKGISGRCVVALSPKPGPGLTAVDVEFTDRGQPPLLVEEVASGSRVRARYRYINSVLKSCGSLTVSFAGSHEKATVRPLAFPKVGSSSSAYRITLPTTLGSNVGIDLVVARSGPYALVLEYSAMGTPSTSVLRSFAHQALAKLTGVGSTAPSPNEVPPRITPAFQ
jgi:hypothetical protein